MTRGMWRRAAVALVLAVASGGALAQDDAMSRQQRGAAEREARHQRVEVEHAQRSAAAEAAYLAAEPGIRWLPRPEPVSFGLAERVTWYAPVLGKPFCAASPPPWRWARDASQAVRVEGVVASVEEVADNLLDAVVVWRTQRREVSILTTDHGRCMVWHRRGGWMPLRPEALR